MWSTGRHTAATASRPSWMTSPALGLLPVALCAGALLALTRRSWTTRRWHTPLPILRDDREYGSQTVALAAVVSEKDQDPLLEDASAKTRQQIVEEAFLKDLETQGEMLGLSRDMWTKMQSPARYLGNELGAFHKQWESVDVRMALAYPEIYEVGISNVGHIALYTAINREEDLLCDRCYLPLPDMAAVLEEQEKPLFAVESQRPLGDFDTIGISLAYELGGCNCIHMMHLGRIPKTWKERLEQEPDGPFDPSKGSHPLMFAGGPTATGNPEPFADFFDFFAIGDGEDCLPEIGQCLKRCREERLNRVDTLFKLCTEVTGIYVPMFYDQAPGWGGAVFPIREGVPERVLRRVSTPDPSAQFTLQPYLPAVHDRLTVEIRRGCTRGCRFCQPGMLTRPARDVEPEKVISAVEEGVREMGYNEFSLLSLSCSDYLALPSVGLEIKNRLKNENVTLSLPSQRVDRFDDNIANIIGGTKKSSITFAPEAGTQRLRDIINKGLTNEELLRGVKTAFERGWSTVKLYFMIGLPGETDADVLGIAETVKWLQKECDTRKRKLKVHLTISNFTPKPHTPFQWHTVSSSDFERKQRMLKRAFRNLKPGSCKVNYTPFRISAMEDFIGRGDRRLCAVMLKAWENGAQNDAWWEGTDEAFASWDKAIEDSGLTWKYRQVEDGEWDVLEKLGDERYRGQGGHGKGRIDRGVLQEERLDRPLPWDHINTGVSKFWLKSDLQRAMEAVTVPDCSHHVCSECGVCGDDFGDNVVVEPPPLPAFDGTCEKDIAKTQKVRIKFAKLGSMACVGHLDTLRLMERAYRRAALPISVTGSEFNARPRVTSALTLPLGWTSESEILEIVLTKHMDVDDIKTQLNAKMPDGMPILDVEEFPLYHMTGKLRESVAEVVSEHELLVQVALDPVAQDAPDAPDAPDADDADDAAAPGGPRDVDWRAVAQATLALPELQLEKTSKRGKTQYFDARRQLLGLEHVPEAQLPAHKGFALPLEPGTAVLRVRGTAVVTGAPGILTMASILKLLEAGGAGPVRMVHTHRESCKVEPLPELPDDVKAEWRALEAKWAEQKRLREAGEPLRTYKWEDGIIFCYD